MGDYSSLQLGTQIAAGSGGAIGAGLVAAGAVGGPIGMAIGGGIAAVASIIGAIFKPDTDKIYTTDIVNQVEPYMKQNVAAWQASGKTKSEQQAALANFNYLWQQVLNGCQGKYGSAGVNCIADRQRGGKWDWFSYYYDPIANDPNVVNDPVSAVSSVTDSVAQTVSNIFSGGGSSSNLVPLMIAGLGLLLVMEL
jgi:hypothetical protein